jgi:hypothetical protein
MIGSVDMSRKNKSSQLMELSAFNVQSTPHGIEPAPIILAGDDSVLTSDMWLIWRGRTHHAVDLLTVLKGRRASTNCALAPSLSQGRRRARWNRRRNNDGSGCRPVQRSMRRRRRRTWGERAVGTAGPVVYMQSMRTEDAQSDLDAECVMFHAVRVAAEIHSYTCERMRRTRHACRSLHMGMTYRLRHRCTRHRCTRRQSVSNGPVAC